jgi:hypothetical protein
LRPLGIESRALEGLAAKATGTGPALIEIHDLAGDIVATAVNQESEHALHETFPTTGSGVPVGGSTPPRFSWLANSGAASGYALGVGVNVSGGAAFVPQLARSLENSQIAPPGSCPTGCGHDQPREPTLDMEGVEAAEALGRQIIAEEEAARESAEAEEAEELVDPIKHYRAWEAKQVGERLLKLSAAGDLTDQLGALFGTLADYIDGYIVAAGTVEIATNWLDEFGEFLVGCASMLHKEHDSHGGCRAEYWDVPIVNVPYFGRKPKVSICAVGKAEATAIDGLGLHGCELLAFSNELHLS